MKKPRIKIPRCWKQAGTLDDYTFFETKKCSKVYPSQPDNDVQVHRHPLNKKKWTYSYGNAVMNMPFLDTEKVAFDAAQHYMELFNKC